MTTRSKTASIIAALIYTLIIVAIPWDEIRGARFADRQEYQDYFLHQESVLDYQTFNGPVDYLKNEALWHFGVSTLLRWNISLDAIFLAISALCVGIASYFVARKHGVIAPILLVNPLLVTLAFSQLRMALAVSLLGMGFLARRIAVVAILFLIVATFIHTATFLVVAVCGFVWLASKRFEVARDSTATLFAALFVAGVIIAIVTGPLLTPILQFLGDRRATTYSVDVSESALYTAFWVGLLAVCAFQPREFFLDRTNGYSVVVLSTVLGTIATGGYTQRLLALSFPVLLSSLLSLKGTIRIFSVVAFVIYAAAQWIYWLRT